MCVGSIWCGRYDGGGEGRAVLTRTQNCMSYKELIYLGDDDSKPRAAMACIHRPSRDMTDEKTVLGLVLHQRNSLYGFFYRGHGANSYW